jgi:putative phosphoesterase
MKILILADIHGNWPALQAVQEPHDLCFCLGDLVDYGLEPIPCIEWVQQHTRYCVRGNHDHAVAQRAATNGRNGFKYLSGVTRQLTWEYLQPLHLRYLASLPVTLRVTVDEVRFLLVHATPRDPLDEYMGNNPDYWARHLQNVDADVVCVGHTHYPYVLPIDDKLIINPGSVGQPRDGDPRASYAVWEKGEAQIKRTAYPVEEVIQRIEASDLPDMAKRISAEVLRTGACPPPEATPKPDSQEAEQETAEAAPDSSS